MHNRHKATVRGSRLAALLLLLILAPAALPAAAQGVAVLLSGKVVDGSGAGIVGAQVKLLETSLAAITGPGGTFELKGTFETGVVRRAATPGGGRLEFRKGRLHLVGEGSRLRVLVAGPGGRSARFLTPGRNGVVDLEPWLAGPAGTYLLRIEGEGHGRSFRIVKPGRQAPVVLLAGAAPSAAARRGLAKAGTAADSAAMVLEVGAPGHLPKRFFQGKASEAGLVLPLLPAGAGLKERIRDFLGPGLTFKVAYLRRLAPGSRKQVLHYRDFAEMTGDTLPAHAFPDSRGAGPDPDAGVLGANVPAWSPDGRTIAYEIGNENQTVANVSRIYLQPLAGARVEGPAFPATNPRFWTDGRDTVLLWCTSGRDDGYKDTSSSTLRQRVSGGALVGEPVLVARGSWHGGLSADGRYLATAFRHAAMLDLQSGARRHAHIYPGQPPAKDGSPADSLQACNPSISPDPARPSRTLFLDFGVPPGDAPYPNVVRPRSYAQHQMILVADFQSDAPGRIVDFIDSPAEELAADKTWDDPEWSNHKDFLVATTRDPDGDRTNPAEPRATQPDIYLIHLPTKSHLKVVSGDHMIMPALWVGREP